MSSSRALRRWAVPAGVAAAVVGASLLVPVVASAEPDLPDRTAVQLLADLRTDVDGFSGTVRYRADLGLPSLPGLGGDGARRPGPPGGSTDLTALLDGEHTLRVWAAAPDRARVSLHGDLGEHTVIHDGDDLWTWSSDDQAVTHVRLPEHPSRHGTGPALRDRLGAVLPPMTPAEVADLALEALDPSTAVRVGDPVTVAGRAAYQLVLEPRTGGTLVDSIHIAIDAADRVPTRVQVFAVGHDRPALEIGFTALALLPPDDGVFAFEPPPGATVEDVDLAALGTRHRAPGASADADRPPGPPWAGDDARPVTVVGDGWTSVLVAELPVELTTGARGDAAGVLDSLPQVEGAWGSGRLVTSRLFSVLLTDDGRVLVGAVDSATLERVAAETPAPAG